MNHNQTQEQENKFFAAVRYGDKRFPAQQVGDYDGYAKEEDAEQAVRIRRRMDTGAMRAAAKYFVISGKNFMQAASDANAKTDLGEVVAAQLVSGNSALRKHESAMQADLNKAYRKALKEVDDRFDRQELANATACNFVTAHEQQPGESNWAKLYGAEFKYPQAHVADLVSAWIWYDLQ